MRRWKRRNLLFSLTLCTTTVEVKSLCSGPIGLLKIIDPCDRPLDPAYPWAHGAFLGPGLNGCSLSFHCAPEVRNGQGRTNEVRAAVQGDLCPSVSSNSLLETGFKATVRILPMNDEFAHACHVVFVLCNAAGSDAKKRLNCKNVRRIKLSGAVYALHWVILYFLSWH